MEELRAESQMGAEQCGLGKRIGLAHLECTGIAPSPHLQNCWVCPVLMWSKTKGSSARLEVCTCNAQSDHAEDSNIWSIWNLGGGLIPWRLAMQRDWNAKKGCFLKFIFYPLLLGGAARWSQGIRQNWGINIGSLGWASVQEISGLMLGPSAALQRTRTKLPIEVSQINLGKERSNSPLLPSPRTSHRHYP